MIAYYTPALVYARAALARGPLIEHRVMGNGRGVFWRHRNRLFSSKTVNLLIDAGEAIRRNGQVVKWNLTGHGEARPGVPWQGGAGQGKAWKSKCVAEAVRRTPCTAPPVMTPAGGATHQREAEGR